MLNNGFGGDAHVSQWMMLASASTIAGNLTILGTASNIIIIDVAESKNVKTFTFFEFFKIGCASYTSKYCHLLHIHNIPLNQLKLIATTLINSSPLEKVQGDIAE